MILNIIINNINNVTKMTSCWDIQESINILKNCLYFIEYITDDSKKPFYNFELYFLLQNTYIYKKNQIIKYKEIINDLLVKNDELSLHQFMMGKGKTSIITPLLAFALINNCFSFSNFINSSFIIYKFIFSRFGEYRIKSIFSFRHLSLISFE